MFERAQLSFLYGIQSFSTEVISVFHTYPNAEFPIPRALASNGERSWTWMELACCVPYFFATVQFRTTDDQETTYVRHYWLSHIDSVLDLAMQSAELGSECGCVRVDLFSPGYINGKDVYQLDQLKEIWRHRENLNLCFVLADGRKLSHCISGDESSFDEMELVVSL